ncbi:uncharacterized protein [Aegilops tauschii subsp. strangulata]|uniref:uncharacterized protein n=1 Tax=Aegilops tauschii subsp. strangulata TaxID=200361 RepID=UPI003CC889B3
MDTHMMLTDLSVVYTNEPTWVESSINTMEQLLAKDKYKVVVFDLEYTGGCAGYYQKIIVTQSCVCHHALIYHYCLATRPYERFAGFVNSHDYSFAMNLVHIQGQYRVWGSKKEKYSLVDLVIAITDPYYRNMKDDSNKNKPTSHRACVHRLYDDHVKYAAKDAYTSYEMYRRIIDMWKCLRPAPGEGSGHKHISSGKRHKK